MIFQPSSYEAKPSTMTKVKTNSNMASPSSSSVPRIYLSWGVTDGEHSNVTSNEARWKHQ